MEHTRTTREPKQAIPTFIETIELLMRPENAHVQFNVSLSFPFPYWFPAFPHLALSRDTIYLSSTRARILTDSYGLRPAA